MTRWALVTAGALIFALSGCSQLVDSLGEDATPTVVEANNTPSPEPALPDIAVAEFAAACSHCSLPEGPMNCEKPGAPPRRSPPPVALTSP
jgi:hypothetical protein